MSDVFVGQILLVPYNFAPKGFALCAGQLMAISQNTALFSLLGTYYGGDGKSNFALPNLQGMIPIGVGQGPGLSDYFQGETSGEVNHTLISSETPAHNHGVSGEKSANQATPVGNSPANGPMYSNQTTNQVSLNANAVAPQGGNLPHNNMMPYQVLNWVIALQGVFPARS